MSTWQVLEGDCLAMLATLPPASVHCVVTSPPYWRLREYQVPATRWADGWVGALGQEPTVAQYIAHLCEVLDGVARVLRPDGTLWLNLGDTYLPRRQPDGGGPKDLALVPQRAAIALQQRGWCVRAVIAWHKLAALPESVLDRPHRAWEPILLLARGQRYYYDALAVRQPGSGRPMLRLRHSRDWPQRSAVERGAWEPERRPRDYLHDGRVALRDVWALGPQPVHGAPHTSVFPPELPRRAILAGTSAHGACAACGAPWRRVLERQRWLDGVPRDDLPPIRPAGHDRPPPNGVSHARYGTWWTARGWEPTCRCGTTAVVPCAVLDPFAGIGTTLLAAVRLGRRAIGIELSPTSAAWARQRLAGEAPLLAAIAAAEAEELAEEEEERCG